MNKNSDVIVVGTSMGGATIGYALAKAGMRVRFLEKGLSQLNSDKALKGRFAETLGFRKNQQARHQLLKQCGRYF